MTIQWADVTDWKTLWAPDDGTAITAAVLAQVQDANAKGATVFSSQYSFTDSDIASALHVGGMANSKNRYLFDSSCCESANDKACVETVITGLPSEQWGVGTSSVNHEILHSKIMAILYPDNTGWTFSGSFNLSFSAQEEFNVADFIWSRSRAAVFAAQISTKLAWVQENQTPQPYFQERD